MNWYLQVFKNYFNFKGRARRKEYWMFALFSYLIATVLGVLDNVMGLRLAQNIGVLSGIYSLFIAIPSLALAFRRLHDINKSATCLFLALIPVIGWIWLVIYFVQEGTHGDNRYGADPKMI